MNRLHLHIPAFVQTDTPVDAIEFQCTADLEEILVGMGMLGKAESLEVSGKYLLSVSADKRTWWVLGMLSCLDNVNLPKWVPPN